MIKEYEADLSSVTITDETRDAVIALARLPLQIRGFGPVKEKNAREAAKRREELLSQIRNPTTFDHAAE